MINKKEVGSKSSSMNKIVSKNSEYRGSASVKKKSASKTMVTPGTKVSQATINKIKSMGMTAALKGASGASAEMQEGLRRMYGAKRVDAATKSKSSVPAQKSTPEKGTGFKRVSPYPYSGVKVKGSGRPAGAPGSISNKSKSSAPSAVSGKKVSTTSSAKKPTPKKSGATDPVARFVFGVGRAIKSGQGAQGMTAAQVAAENKRRAAANKNK